MFSLKKVGKSIEIAASRLKQHCILSYLMNACGGRELLDNYPPKAASKPCEPLSAHSPIWTCWWQGEEQMPPVVKACYAAMKRCAGAHPVILITQHNFADYVTMPDYVLEKQRRGIIDLTHFSDILRMMLLREHGGIWMDSTLLIPSGKLDDFIPPGTDYWSCHHITRYRNVSRGGWVSFFVAAGKGHILPSFIADLHLSYWKRRNRLVDYLLLDYCCAVARRELPEVQRLIESLPLSEMGPLGKQLNEPFTEEGWHEACTRYRFHKITYKIPLHTHTPDGRLTNYGHILEEFPLDLPNSGKEGEREGENGKNCVKNV